ncbi:MAG: hypothetical protein ACI8W7_001736 [Gammaproteobacteria bacterium]|jgi:hypothetical protein
MNQVASSIYLIRTAVRESAGMAYGGVMRIKIGRHRVAYAGFRSVDLARIACAYWSVSAEHFIEPWDMAIRCDSVDARLPRVLLFHNEVDFRAWLQNPESFDIGAHTVSLHFGSLDSAPPPQPN